MPTLPEDLDRLSDREVAVLDVLPHNADWLRLRHGQQPVVPGVPTPPKATPFDWLLTVALKYSPRQPRDDHGRWTAGLATGGAFDPAPTHARPQHDSLVLRNLMDANWPAGQRELAEDTRARVANALADRLTDNPDWQAVADALLTHAGEGPDAAPGRDSLGGDTPEARKARSVAAANLLLGQWAYTTGQPGQLSQMMQFAVQEEFNLGSLPRTGTVAAFGTLDYDTLKPGMKAFSRAMYDNTQDYLRANGITSLPLYRGLALDNPTVARLGIDTFSSDTRHYATITTAPASSFSLNPASAAAYAKAPTRPGLPEAGAEAAHIPPVALHQMNNRVVVAAEVPAGRILSTPQTGIGSKEDSEVTVLGGTDTVAYMAWDEATRSPDAMRAIDKAIDLLDPDPPHFVASDPPPPAAAEEAA